MNRKIVDRHALRLAYRQEESACVNERCREAQPVSNLHGEASRIAAALVTGARERKASGIDAFLHTYGLDTEEGIALMCLAEALLRVPDARTADALIDDKLGTIDWSDHVGQSSSTFVNAATFSLMLTGEVLRGEDNKERTLTGAFRRATNRLGEPVIRTAVLKAMRILGGQFVYGRTIEESLKRARPEREKGLTHSFDMLGEVAMTYDDAERYRVAYTGALQRLAREGTGNLHDSPGISVKLSALYPRYVFTHAEDAREALVPILKDMMEIARDANLHFTIDAEEADRLEPSLDVIEEVLGDDEVFTRADGSAWEGFGLAIQAYQKRGAPLCDWVIAAARRHGRKLMVRLVKGAYWDTEIKLSQVGGFTDFPVFTRKLGTDVSYLACSAKLLAADDAVYAAFATHNAYTIGAVKALAGDTPFEFQRLHGMGEEVYAELATLEKGEGDTPTNVRIYAPTGGHKDLLAYLVRRLLENGANSSFVNRMADADVPVEELTTDPVAEMSATEPKRNPAIPLPADIFPNRLNSAGVDLSDPLVREPLLERLDAIKDRHWLAEPTFRQSDDGELAPITMPQNLDVEIGTRRDAQPEDVDYAITAAQDVQPGWNALGGEKRALLLEEAARLFEEHTDEFLSLCQREAGKNLLDAVLELREAVDFLRFYANEARRLFSGYTPLPGPTGEENRLTLNGRGVFVTISPWNFPLAIFVGPAAAALAAGNTVVAKPAEQTPLIAALAVRLCHEAGIPKEVFQLMPGAGEVGEMLTGDPRVAGVAFTGSGDTARAINRSLAAREGAIATFIAETGGQNSMIIDSSALPEQVARDVVASAFQSAGQRCSALRMLYIQDEVFDEMLAMIRGAFEALVIGDPADLATDVGPVIDPDAKAALERHVARRKKNGRPVWRRRLPRGHSHGCFVAPTIIELDSIADLRRENFGPVLHVARYKSQDLGKVMNDINATGFGLTLGLHSRIDAVREFVEARARTGNFYVNRNQIGAVVESQPFGGEGLSGTGPKAGGPNYVARFATERVVTIDTTAAGGNASLMAAS